MENGLLEIWKQLMVVDNKKGVESPSCEKLKISIGTKVAIHFTTFVVVAAVYFSFVGDFVTEWTKNLSGTIYFTILGKLVFGLVVASIYFTVGSITMVLLYRVIRAFNQWVDQ